MIDILVNQTGLDRNTIVNLLPFILIEIRNYTNQYFLTLKHNPVIKIENKKIYLDGEIQVSVGDTIELMNSENNTLIYQVKTVGDGYVEVEQDFIVDEIDNEHIVMIKLSFKNVNLKTIGGMLEYDEKFGDLSGIKSQTLGGYNVTYASADGGDTAYPLELYGGVNSLKKLNDDYAEYRRKGYVRLWWITNWNLFLRAFCW